LDDRRDARLALRTLVADVADPVVQVGVSDRSFGWIIGCEFWVPTFVAET